MVQFFNDIVGLLGAFGFWPLTIFFPTQVWLACILRQALRLLLLCCLSQRPLRCTS